MTNNIIVLVGNIGSGKSTLVKQYQEQGYIVIARDMLRYAIGGGEYVFNPEYEPIIWNTELSLLDDFLNKGVNIIVDEVGLSKAMRRRYIDIAEIYDYNITCIQLRKLSKEESVNRRMINPHGTNDRKVWGDVWEKFNKQYEEPSLDEGFDEIIHV